ncbi:unnamed protein product [Ambrosiozyma monospora]|uniref:Unnamed protein product n=1 Tax=Ambrosiozyma monospora TaxID=43982 RepID=A0ACB5TQN8_AMBMO|nr:unnamed protein product [Ambrosiozyma monospora]
MCSSTQYLKHYRSLAFNLRRLAASLLVTPYSNTLALELASVLVIESILQQPSSFIIPQSNGDLSTVWSGYQNYSSSIDYHPGFMFMFKATETTQLYEYYSSFHSHFNDEALNFISSLVDQKDSEFDKLTSKTTLPSN